MPLCFKTQRPKTQRPKTQRPKTQRPKTQRHLLAALYFAHMGGIGAWLPFLGLHLDRQGVSGAAIGAVLATIPAARMLSAPGWALIADRFHSGRALLRIATIGSLLAAACIALLPLEPLGIGLALVVFSALRAPVAPLLDTAAVKLISDEGGDPRNYGRLRLWGTVGFLSMSAIGAMLVATTPTASGSLSLAVGCWSVASALTLVLPPAPSAAPAPVWPALKRLARMPVMAPLLVALCLHGLGLSLYDTTLAMHFEARGLVGGWVAGALATGLLAEVAVLWWGRALLLRLGAFRLLTLAGAAGALRWGLTAVVTTPLLLVGIQALHGLVYAAFWIAGVEVMRSHAPPEVRVSAQSLLTATAYGVGALLAAGAVSALLDTIGTSGLFGVAAGVSVLTTAGMAIAERLSGPQPRSTAQVHSSGPQLNGPSRPPPDRRPA